MSLQFQYGAILLLVASFNVACASGAPQGRILTPEVAPTSAPLPEAVSDARLLDQLSNAARLEALH